MLNLFSVHTYHTRRRHYRVLLFRPLPRHYHILELWCHGAEWWNISSRIIIYQLSSEHGVQTNLTDHSTKSENKTPRNWQCAINISTEKTRPTDPRRRSVARNVVCVESNERNRNRRAKRKRTGVVNRYVVRSKRQVPNHRVGEI